MSYKQKIDIIMLNMSNFTDWEKGIANRNYHVLQTLAKDERIGKIVAVDFLPLGFDWKRKLKYYYINIIKGAKAYDCNKRLCVGSGETRFGDLTSRCYQINSKIHIYSSVNSLSRVLEELSIVKQRLEMNNLLVWSYNPFIGDLKHIKEVLGAKQVVFDAVDDWSKHSVYKSKKQVLDKNYQKIKEEADIIFTVSEDLKNNLFSKANSVSGEKPSLQNRVHWIPNGVELERFEFQPNYIPQDLQEIKKPIIGYEGVIQDRLDIDLIKYLAEKNRDKNFVFVGWLWRGLDEVINREFAELDNVLFLGRKKYEELSAYIHTFDIGIIPHKINDFTKSMNPLKMYEYLACGKPIVSTDVSGIGEFGDFVKIGKTKEDFNKLINEELDKDNEDLKRKRVDTVRNHSWEKRVGEMLKCVDM